MQECLLTCLISIKCISCHLLSYQRTHIIVGAVAKYCNEHICVFVCVSVCEHIFQTTRAIFTKLFLHVAYGHASVLRRGNEIPGEGTVLGVFFPIDSALCSISFGTHKNGWTIEMLFGMWMNVMWICIAHCRKTSNALYALVCCKQKRFQLFSETVSADGRVSQVLWQWVPNLRTCHRESPSGRRTQPVARYVQKLSAGISETLPRRDCGAWEAEVDQVLGCLAFQTAVHHDTELVLNSLGYMEPMQLSVQQPRQASVVLLSTTDDSGMQPHWALVVACPSSLLTNPPRQCYSSQRVMTRKREQL